MVTPHPPDKKTSGSPLFVARKMSGVIILDEKDPTAIEMSGTGKADQMWPIFKATKPDPVLGKLHFSFT